MARLEDLLARYENWMRANGWTERTVDVRRHMAERILFQWPDPTGITPADLMDWLGNLGSKRGRIPSQWTRATYHGHVRAFFRWLKADGIIESDPTASELFRRPKSPSGHPKPLTKSEESRALMAARGNVRAWLLLALRQGLRAHEIAKIRGEDVQEDMIYVRGKGGKEAHLPTHPDIWALAQRYPRRGWWFPSPAHDGHISGNAVTILVGRLFRQLQIDGSIHRARHSYGTTLLRAGANMRVVQTLMRHSSPATTALYTAVDEDELRAAINLLGDAS